MIDIEEIGLEPVTLGDASRLGHHRSGFAVASAGVMPERQVRTPLHLHQRAHAGFAQDRFDARDQRRRRFPLRLPIDVIEHRRGRQHPQVEIFFAVDKLVETLCASHNIVVFRPPQ